MEVVERSSMKRKDIDRVNEEFSDFSLSSPARKIRRLDADLPPIMEEEEIDMAMQEMVPNLNIKTSKKQMVAEEIGPAPVNEERAIVLFKPLHYDPPRSGNLFVDKDLISGFKNRFFHDASSVANDNQNEDETTNKCQAVVCWNPNQSLYSQSRETIKQPCAVEITELDETGEDVVMDEADMEIEEDNRANGLCFPRQGQQQQQQEEPAHGFLLHQWQQQQNCITPQLPQVSTSPITWFG